MWGALACVTGAVAFQRPLIPHIGHRESPNSQFCAPLANHGSHSTVRIEVGTPSQVFDVVADTGSNAVIVLSCACVDNGRCDDGDKCFRGTNRSSTFDVKTTEDESMPTIVMSFGSGDIQAVVATDIVKVGDGRAKMNSGLLLMVDKQLDFGGPFEGILGLGIPQQQMPSLSAGPSYIRQIETGEDFTPPEFLPTAKISRFSMCFNDGSSGVLRLGTEPATKTLGSVGKLHWGLGLNGISVGEKHASVAICDPKSMVEGQETPCGAIPDSGTTAIMAPKASLISLFESICDEWPRCKKEADRSKQEKPMVFGQLLHDCESWMTSSHGLKELPSLHFHVAGAEGRNETLELGGWAYVLETVEADAHHAAKHLADVMPRELFEGKGRANTVCSPAFGVMEMPTQSNGDVWILGTPFFYTFNVNYDLHSEPPSIAFAEEACGSCDDEASYFASGKSAINKADAATRGPRQIHGPWRVPNINISKHM